MLALLTATVRSVDVSVRPSTPTTAMLSADALRLVQLRVGSARSLASARPKSTPCRSRPWRSARPPPVPTKASALAAPSVKSCAATTSPSASVSEEVERSKAKPPDTWKKPNRSTSTVPEACSSSPREPAMSSVTEVDVPVATTTGVPAKSITGSVAPVARLPTMSSSSAAIVRPSMPSKDTAPVCAFTARQPRASLAASLNRPSASCTSLASKPMKSVLPPFRPTWPVRPVPPRSSCLTSTVPPPARSSVVSSPQCTARLPLACRKSPIAISAVVSARSCAPAVMRLVKVWFSAPALTAVPARLAAVWFRLSSTVCADSVTWSPMLALRPPLASSAMPPVCTSSARSPSLTPSWKSPAETLASTCWPITVMVSPVGLRWKAKSPLRATPSPTVADTPVADTARKPGPAARSPKV